MHGLAPLIYDLTVMLGVAAIVVLIFQRIRQPVVLGYLVAGMIIGPYTPPYSLISETQDIQALSELGVVFLMFSLGLEFSFHKLMRVGFSASAIGLIEVVLMMLAGYTMGILLGWPHDDSLFFGAALSISSTTIIIKAIDELKLKTRRFAELIFGVLIVEDLLAIILLASLPVMVLTDNIISTTMLISVIKLVMVVGGWFIVGYFIVPSMFRQIVRYVSAETLTIVSVALCLFLVAVASKLHYSSALGAFIMGSILAETVLVKRIEELIMPIRDVFAAVFFISVGMLIDPSVIIDKWDLVLIATAVTIVGKVLTTGLGALLSGQSINTSIRVGLSMAQIGEFSFIIAGLGVAMGVTNNTLYPLIVAVSAITTFTTPYLIRLSGVISTEVDRKLPENAKFFLANYSAWVYRATTSAQHLPWFQKVSIRMMINGIMVAIVFTATNAWVSPYLSRVINKMEWAETAGLLIAMLGSMPFIWGMLFSYRYAQVPSFGASRINPAVSLIWLVTIMEISVLSAVYFQTWITIILILSIFALFFVYAYQHIEKSYQWFESKFVANIQRQDAKERYEALAPWDNHLVELHVDINSPFAGKTLNDCRIRDEFNVNVVAIHHGNSVIAAPRGHEMISAFDRLIVLGTDDNIDKLKVKLESEMPDETPVGFLDDFMLKGLLLTKNHPFIGKSIRDVRIRERVNGMVVGLERNGNRILNPSLDEKLQADDLLLIVGSTEKMWQL